MSLAASTTTIVSTSSFAAYGVPITIYYANIKQILIIFSGISSEEVREILHALYPNVNGKIVALQEIKTTTEKGKTLPLVLWHNLN